MSDPKPMMSETSAWRTDGNGAPVTSTRGMYSEQMVEATLAWVLAMHETELGEHGDVARWSLELPLSVDTEPHSRAWHLAWSGTVAGLRIEVEASESNLAQTWTITEVRVVRLERSGRLSPRDLEVGFEARTEADVRADVESTFERERANPKPMDPKRLKKLRDSIDEVEASGVGSLQMRAQSAIDLLADRDHWEAETKKAYVLRDGAVERAKLCLVAKDHAQAEAKRWRSECPVTSAHVEAAGVTWSHFDAYFSRVHPPWVGGRRVDIPNAINRSWDDKCPLDRLDEMAALAVEPAR